MRIQHFIYGKANKLRANGVNQVISGMATYTASNGVPVSVLGLAQTAAFEGELIERDGFGVTVYTHNNRAFREAVDAAVRAADVVHLHGVYSPLNIQLGRVCYRLGTPYVVTLHGGLASARNTWRNKLQKRFFHWALQKQHLERAALIHALTEEESTDALAHFQPKAMTVIPNGVDLKDFPSILVRERSSQHLKIGYLGRISQEKNLDALCEAFSKVNSDNKMRLLLAGPDSTYGDRIKNRWSQHGVVLVGPKFGAEKFNFLDSIDLFVHPSKADVFSISAMEALARNVPLVLSRTSDASHFVETGAFIMCEPTAFGIEKALRKALSRQADWSDIAARGRCLIEKRLNWNAAAMDLISNYRTVCKADS
jgi:glycosyltransferase involved in cell wall biosynthesis